MQTILKLVPIGNSQGIRLPQALLRRYHFEKEIRAVETPDGILLQPVERGKLSWAETFAASALENQAENVAWETTLGEGLESEDFAGWPR